ncbi:MAG: SDR family oxidoreductase [Terriglobales bacterium]
MQPPSVVTGAFGFTGKYIAEELLRRGERVRTLTAHPDRSSPLFSRVEVAPLEFSSVEALAQSMEGAKVLYNTYWIRFAYGKVNHARAVENSRILIQAAETAGVERVVHISITNPSPHASTPYFRGKAAVEEAILSSKLSHAILRPALLFGEGDILINNIAWLLRHCPIFAVPGSGDYALQPIFVEELATLATDAGRGRDNVIVHAVGPETYTYSELVRLIRAAVGSRSHLVHVPAWMVPTLIQPLNWMLNDVLLTSDELRELTENVLVAEGQPAGHASFRRWLEGHADTVGKRYASELDRHYRRG